MTDEFRKVGEVKSGKERLVNEVVLAEYAELVYAAASAGIFERGRLQKQIGLLHYLGMTKEAQSCESLMEDIRHREAGEARKKHVMREDVPVRQSVRHGIEGPTIRAENGRQYWQCQRCGAFRPLPDMMGLGADLYCRVGHASEMTCYQARLRRLDG